MPSKLKNAIGNGNVNIGFSAALRNAPIPVEQIKDSLNYDDIADNVGARGRYHFRNGNFIYAGSIADIIRATDLRLALSDSSGDSVAATLRDRFIGEILRYTINSDNYLEFTISGSIVSTQNYHTIPITFRRTGISNITSVSNSPNTRVTFDFSELIFPAEAIAPQVGLFGVLQWERLLLVSHTSQVGAGDVELLASGGGGRAHLTDDNVDSVAFLAMEFEDGSLLERFANNIKAGKTVYIYRNQNNVVAFDATLVNSTTVASGRIRRLASVTYNQHALDVDGIDASSVDVPIYLGVGGGSVSSGGGGGSEVNEVGKSLTNRLELTGGIWNDVITVEIEKTASDSAILLDSYEQSETSDRLGSIRQSQRLIYSTPNTPVVISQIGDEIETPLRADILDEPLQMRGIHKPSGSVGSKHEYKLQVYSFGAPILFAGNIFNSRNPGDTHAINAITVQAYAPYIFDIQNLFQSITLIAADGEYFWGVSYSSTEAKYEAYRMSDGVRDSSKDIPNETIASGSLRTAGFYNPINDIVYITYSVGQDRRNGVRPTITMRAYAKNGSGNRVRSSSDDIDLGSSAAWYGTGATFDGTYIYILDNGYRASSIEDRRQTIVWCYDTNGNRQPTRDILVTGVLALNAATPVYNGIGSDHSTIWLRRSNSAFLEAYNIASGVADDDKDISLKSVVLMSNGIVTLFDPAYSSLGTNLVVKEIKAS